MKSNRGYIAIDFGAMFVVILLIGAVLGAAAWALMQWLWPLLKAWLHQVTA
jgi:hypothetical protein